MSELFSGPPDRVLPAETQLRAIGEAVMLHGSFARQIIMRSAGYDTPPMPVTDEWFDIPRDMDDWHPTHWPYRGDIGHAGVAPHPVDYGLTRRLQLVHGYEGVCLTAAEIDLTVPIDPQFVRPVTRIVEGRTGPIRVATFSRLTQLILNGGILSGPKPKHEESFEAYRDFIRWQLREGQLTGPDAPLPIESYNTIAGFNRQVAEAPNFPGRVTTKFVRPITDIADLLNI